MKKLKIPRLILTGTSSGVGKTSITSAIIYAIKKRGYSVQPFKVGPDYIDPSYLSSIAKNDTINLDAWLMGKQELVKSFVRNSKSNISVIEGVMGYYDGFSGDSNYSSTHHVATLLKSPTILVLDASKTARSIAATALGFTKFHKNSRIVGLILNKIGSKKHEELCLKALEPLKIPILGSIPKSTNLLDSRHLGLIPVVEQKKLKTKIEKIAKEISDSLFIDKIIKITKNVSDLQKINEKPIQKPKTTIAVALDNSFNFYYKDNLDALRREGAKLKFFSPVSDSKVPSCDGLYIGGGFPEILGNSLAKNNKMRKSIKDLAENNMPVYAECGGLMYLTKSIHDGKKKHQMVGLIDAETKMTKKMTLNYTEGRINKQSIISNGSQKLHTI
jgi:cobyrinic acid a,c-diamide synthase